jgi:hypothetical protein
MSGSSQGCGTTSAAREKDARSDSDLREAIARTLDPEAWEKIDGHRVVIESLSGGAMPSLCAELRRDHENDIADLCFDSLAKADSILSLMDAARAAHPPENSAPDDASRSVAPGDSGIIPNPNPKANPNA